MTMITQLKTKSVLLAVVAGAACAVVLALAAANMFGESGEATDGGGTTFERAFDISATVPAQGRGAFAAAGYAGAPRQLSAQECSDALPRMEAQAKILGEQLKARNAAAAERERLDAAVEASRNWFVRGCPPHGVLGFYESTSGDGSLRSVLIDY